MENPAIDQLAATPEILRLIMAGLTDEQAGWKPGPDRWSIAEIVEHLSHVEGHLFRVRLDRMMAEESPEVQNYDQDEYSAAGTYSNRDAEESFAHWEEQREDNVRLLEELEPEALERTAVHTTLGKFTLAQMLNSWAYHDAGHVRQIAEIVRTLVYYPRMGPFQAEYQPKP
jgi:hypothetical protein